MTGNAEWALERVKTKLMLLPTSRIVDSDSWDAVTLDTALSVVDEVAAELRETTTPPNCSGVHLWVGRDRRPATGATHDRCDRCGTRRGHCTCPLNARSCPWHGGAGRG